MELRMISKKQDSIEIELIGQNETLLEALKEKLLEDPNVVVANYFSDHPVHGTPRLYVKVRKGKPQAAIKKAAKALVKEFSEMRNMLLKSMEK